MSKFLLRKSLYKVSSHLGREDLKSIKFLCSDDLPRRKLECLHSAFEVFCALEAGGLIDYGKTGHLLFLLNHIGRGHLLSKYPIESAMSPVCQPLPGTFSKEQMKATRAFLVELSASFSEKESRTLANFFFDPSATSLQYEDVERMTGTEDLFGALLDERVIQPNNLSQLSTVLEIMGRNDLKEKVVHHQQVQQAFHSNQVINPTPETSLPQHLSFPPYGASNSSIFSPTTPCTDHHNGTVSLVSMDHPPPLPQALPGQAGVPTPMEQDPVIPNPVIGRSPAVQSGQNPVEGSLIAHSRLVRGYEPSVPSATTAQLQREIERRREMEQSLSLQVKQLSQTQKDQQEMIRRLVREKKILEQESFRNPDCYEMNRKPHGLALVIGNEHFRVNPNRPGLQLEHRKGCEFDIRNYESTFSYLDYEVRAYQDVCAETINHLVSEIGTMDHSQYDSFVFCISTHGERDHFVFGSDTNTVDMNQVIRTIQENDTLSGKPKMFFIQACRTKATDIDGQVSADGGDLPKFSYHPDADVYIAFATTPNHSSYRSPDYGSWFVVALANVVTEYAISLDLQSFMTKVNATVCEAEGHDGTSLVRQCVETVSRLTKAVYFFPAS